MKRLLLALAVTAGLFPTTRGAAQQRDSLAATVERLSAEIETLKGRSAAADRILSRLPRISGYLQLGYEWSDDASTFFVKRARVNFQGDISPKIDYRLQLEFASPKIVDIYLRYKPLEALNVQVGQFKVPFSIENTHYVPLKYEFIEYSMAVCRLMGFTDVCGVNATGRDLGAQLYGGLIGRDGYSILNYNVGVFNGEGINIKDKNKSKDVVVRLMVQPLRALSFAGYYYWGEVGADYARRTRYGGGVCYDDGRWIARRVYRRPYRHRLARRGRTVRQPRLLRDGRLLGDSQVAAGRAVRAVRRSGGTLRIAADQLHGGRRVAAREIPALPAQLHLRRLCVPRRRQPQCGVADALRNFLIELP